MRLFAVVLLVGFMASSASADPNEDRAKAAAIDFLKALKAKDLDAAMKLSGTPFAYRDGDNLALLKDEDAIKKWLKERLAEIKDPNEIPTKLNGGVFLWADVKEKVRNMEQRKTLEEIVGKDGFVAVTMADGKNVPILVRVKDGQAKIVGFAK
jgi:hypothetical protein